MVAIIVFTLRELMCIHSSFSGCMATRIVLAALRDTHSLCYIIKLKKNKTRRSKFRLNVIKIEKMSMNGVIKKESSRLSCIDRITRHEN